MIQPTRSLAGRLLLGSLVLLPLFLGGTGLYLERSYRLSLESAQAQRLQLQVLTLLAEAEFEQSLFMPEELLETRFNQPNSGLFAVVSTAQGKTLWSSRSAITADLTAALAGQPPLAPGKSAFTRTPDLYRYAWAVLWQTDTGQEVPLLFTVLETTQPLLAQLSSLRRSLLLWLGGASLALVISQMLVLLWGLRPLRSLAADIARIEAGEAQELGGNYPTEIQALTNNLGSLLQVEEQRRERTRNTLSDLAHSLKTPLAVIRSANAGSDGYSALVADQADQMEQIVSYQLQRASGGSHNLLRLIAVAPSAQRLRDTLQKVYADKALHIDLEISPDSSFRGDERDLLELLGNLMDNGCKYGRSRVQVTASGSGPELFFYVEDDGEGIPTELRNTITGRGVRADTTQPGQGIGLAVAADIADSYGGRLAIDKSELGGAKVSVKFSP